jgi:hypothetical protein
MQCSQTFPQGTITYGEKVAESTSNLNTEMENIKITENIPPIDKSLSNSNLNTNLEKPLQ